MKINGFRKKNEFKKINLKNPRNFKKINLNDKIYYSPKNNSRINALVIERGNITASTVYRDKNPQGKEMINIDVCFIDCNEKTKKKVIKTMLYQETYQNHISTKGHYKYLDKILTKAGM